MEAHSDNDVQIASHPCVYRQQTNQVSIRIAGIEQYRQLDIAFLIQCVEMRIEFVLTLNSTDSLTSFLIPCVEMRSEFVLTLRGS